MTVLKLLLALLPSVDHYCRTFHLKGCMVGMLFDLVAFMCFLGFIH